jgi:hypothetical protein
MTLLLQPSGLPREIRHPGTKALALMTRIRAGEGENTPPVSVSFLLAGEWSEEYDWWRACKEPEYLQMSIGSSVDEAARAELDSRGWELLGALGYIPANWYEPADDALV